jgi:hypothetical protein
MIEVSAGDTNDLGASRLSQRDRLIGGSGVYYQLAVWFE